MKKTLPLFSLSLALSLAAPAFAQDEHELSTPTGYRWYYGASATTITNAITAGYRPTDIEVESASPLRFTVAMVQNTGVYQSGYWWYYGITASQLATYLSANTGRLIDLEAYDVNGQTRFACIMVPNTGSNAKSWWYYHGLTGAQVSSQLGAHNARPVDLDSYEINGSTYYDVVMIHNSGADYRNYVWYYNVPVSTIQASVNNGRRVYDLEVRPNGNFNAILIAATGQPNWTWWYGLDAAGVTERLGNYGHRPVDLETYFVNGQRRFAMATVNNSNALTTSVGGMMRATTTGTVGCLLQQINGGELAGLNENRQFEPASTMKSLHHVHAFRRIRLGQATLNTPINVFTGMVGSCPQDTGPVTETLTNVLRQMMESSNNARTQAVTAYFGQNSINATAAALGMASTGLNHRIGCAGPALSNPNDITLRDLARLHSEVANGYLGSFRDEFYEHMLNGTSWGGISAIIDQESASLSVSTAAKASFKALVALAQKGGSYTLNGDEYRAGFGWVTIPFLSGNQLAPREYAVGAFVNNASNGANASTAVSQAIGEMLRPTIRSALSTWNLTAVAVSVGTGCSQPQPLLQSVTGMPRIGQTPIYRVSQAAPNSLAAMTFGFNDQNWGGLMLPGSLAFAGAPGCFAYNDAASTTSMVANAAGQAQVPIALPNHYSFLGMEFFTQFYSFGAGLRSSNGFRSVVGD